MNSNWSYQAENLKSGPNCHFFSPCDLKISLMTLKNNRVPLLGHFKLQFWSHLWTPTRSTVQKCSIYFKIGNFSPCVTLKFKKKKKKKKKTGHLFHAHRSYGCHFITIHEFKLELLSGNTTIGTKLSSFQSVWPWNFTDDLKRTIGHHFYVTSNIMHNFTFWMDIISVNGKCSWIFPDNMMTETLWKRCDGQTDGQHHS